MRTATIVLGAALITSVFAGVIGNTQETLAKRNDHKVTICHATGSTKNPYVKISVAYQSIVKQGHDQHQGDRDIIPALPEHKYPGKNLHLISTLENNCKTASKAEPTQPKNPVKPVGPNKPVKPTQPKDSVKPDNKQHKYTICHATNSASNPYRVITVDYNSLIKMGHGSHQGPVATSKSHASQLKSQKIRWGDVVPAIAKHGYAGVNYTHAGKNLLANNCKATVGVGSQKPGAEKPVEDQKVDQKPVSRSAAVAAKTPIATEVEVETPLVVSTLPATGATSSPLLILLAGLLTAGTSYLLPHLRSLMTKQ